MNLYKETKGKKTTAAMVAYLAVRGVTLFWPDLLSADQSAFAIDVITILGAIGVGDKLLNLIKKKR